MGRDREEEKKEGGMRDRTREEDINQMINTGSFSTTFEVSSIFEASVVILKLRHF